MLYYYYEPSTLYMCVSIFPTAHLEAAKAVNSALSSAHEAFQMAGEIGPHGSNIISIGNIGDPSLSRPPPAYSEFVSSTQLQRSHSHDVLQTTMNMAPSSTSGDVNTASFINRQHSDGCYHLGNGCRSVYSHLPPLPPVCNVENDNINFVDSKLPTYEQCFSAASNMALGISTITGASTTAVEDTNSNVNISECDSNSNNSSNINQGSTNATSSSYSSPPLRLRRLRTGLVSQDDQYTDSMPTHPDVPNTNTNNTNTYIEEHNASITKPTMNNNNNYNNNSLFFSTCANIGGTYSYDRGSDATSGSAVEKLQRQKEERLSTPIQAIDDSSPQKSPRSNTMKLDGNAEIDDAQDQYLKLNLNRMVHSDTIDSGGFKEFDSEETNASVKCKLEFRWDQNNERSEISIGYAYQTKEDSEQTPTHSVENVQDMSSIDDVKNTSISMSSDDEIISKNYTENCIDELGKESIPENSSEDAEIYKNFEEKSLSVPDEMKNENVPEKSSNDQKKNEYMNMTLTESS